MRSGRLRTVKRIVTQLIFYLSQKKNVAQFSFPMTSQKRNMFDVINSDITVLIWNDFLLYYHIYKTKSLLTCSLYSCTGNRRKTLERKICSQKVMQCMWIFLMCSTISVSTTVLCMMSMNIIQSNKTIASDGFATVTRHDRSLKLLFHHFRCILTSL